MNKRRLLISLSAATLIAAAGCSTTPSGDTVTPSMQADYLAADAKGAVARLEDEIPASSELVESAKGVLVLPAVRSAGLVVGGSYGEGTLLVDGEPDGYYKMTAGAVGVLAGVQSKAIYLLFMTDESLDTFRTADGWAIGADAGVTLLESGASASITSKSAQNAIIGYVLTNNGLMFDLSLEGTKFSKLDLPV